MGEPQTAPYGGKTEPIYILRRPDPTQPESRTKPFNFPPKGETMKLLQYALPAWILLSLGPCLGGCAFRTRDNAQWQITFGSQIGVSTTATATQAEGSASTEFPSLEALIFRSARDQTGEGEPGPTIEHN